MQTQCLSVKVNISHHFFLSCVCLFNKKSSLTFCAQVDLVYVQKKKKKKKSKTKNKKIKIDWRGMRLFKCKRGYR